MAPLAILLSADPGGGHGTGGLLAAVYLLAGAAGGPVSARLADRHGQRRVLAAGGVLSSTAFLTLAAGSEETWWAAGAVAVAGAARPPLDAALRARWGTGGTMPSAAHQRVALALDSTTQEINYIVGPLLVTAITMAVSAPWALVATGAAGGLGTALFVSAAHPRVRGSSAGRENCLRAGRGRHPALRHLYLAMTCNGITLGALSPLAVQAAERLDAPGLTGGLPAALSCGAVAGGLLYGAAAGRAERDSRLTALSVCFAAGWLPLTAVDNPTVLLFAAAVPGLAMAPLLGAALATTSAHAPRGHMTQAHALLVAGMDIGCAIGTAAADLTRSLLLLPAGATAAALILTASRRHPTPPRPDHPALAPAAMPDANGTSP
ncbi:MFS transporter [Streptomyces sp. 4F14]|uniref:MFS transporter n=1 Tax=Streptomyces sp. 4F14 TaxID=3394380 RepID=UPI003A87C76D